MQKPPSAGVYLAGLARNRCTYPLYCCSGPSFATHRHSLSHGNGKAPRFGAFFGDWLGDQDYSELKLLALRAVAACAATLSPPAFGQFIYVNPAEQVVVAMWSAQPKPVGTDVIDEYDFFNALSDALH